MADLLRHARFGPRRAEGQARTGKDELEEADLAHLRHLAGVTQSNLALPFGGRQSYISRIEKRADMRVSTLVRYVEALGAELEFRVVFPDGKKLRIGQFHGAPRRRIAGAES